MEISASVSVYVRAGVCMLKFVYLCNCVSASVYSLFSI